MLFVSCQMWVLSDLGVRQGLTEVPLGVVYCFLLGGEPCCSHSLLASLSEAMICL